MDGWENVEGHVDAENDNFIVEEKALRLFPKTFQIKCYKMSEMKIFLKV